VQDFSSPLRFSFNEGSNVIAVKVTAKTSPSLDVRLNYDKEHVLDVEPLLLNPGDGFSLHLVIEGMETMPAVSGRIAGITHAEIGDFDGLRRVPLPIFWVTVGAALLSGVTSLMVLAHAMTTGESAFFLLAGAMGAGFGTVCSQLWSYRHTVLTRNRAKL